MQYLGEWASHIFSGEAGGEDYSHDIHIDNVFIQNLDFPLDNDGCLDYGKLSLSQVLIVSYELFYQLVYLCIETQKIDLFMPLLRIEIPSCETLTCYSPSVLENDFDGFTPPSLFLYSRKDLACGIARRGLILTETIDLKNEKMQLLNCDVHCYYETYFDRYETEKPYRREVLLEAKRNSGGTILTRW